MANDAVDSRAPYLNAWRIAGWSIPVILLVIPAVAMRFTGEVDWSTSDFIVMGALFGTIGLGVEFLIRQSPNIAYRIGAVLALVTAFLTIWINLAVRMIGDDNPYNLLFGGVIIIALAGAIITRFEPAGMARAMVAAGIAQAAVGAFGLAQDLRGGVLSIAIAGPWMLSAALFRKAARETAAAPGG